MKQTKKKRKKNNNHNPFNEQKQLSKSNQLTILLIFASIY